MGNIVNFGQRKAELDRRECGEMILRLNRLELAERTKHCDYVVDLDLMMEGWLPVGAIPIDRNFFTRKNRFLPKIKVNTREERSEMEDGTPCMIVYREGDSLLGKGFGYGPVFS